MRVVLIFLDGVGIGRNDPATNPFFQAQLPTLKNLLGGGIPHSRQKSISTPQAECKPVNATLGVAGLPQSGTGQTAIFTGVNAAKRFGKHYGPFPPSTLREVIKSQNIFRQIMQLGKSVAFANAFPQRFFDFTNSGTRRLTVTTLSCMMAGVPLLRVDDLRRNGAVSAELTRERWPELGYSDIPPISAGMAGKHLWAIASRHDFTLFEYWLTDHAGHSQKMDLAVETLHRFDEFLGGFLEEFDSKRSLLILISDHGNIEDLSTKSHTRNQVPGIAVGERRREFLSSVKNLTHVTPGILSLFRQS